MGGNINSPRGNPASQPRLAKSPKVDLQQAVLLHPSKKAKDLQKGIIS